MISATGLEGPRPGCVVTDASPPTAPGTQLVVLNGRAYLRVDVPSGTTRRWRLEPLELEQAIAWLIREQLIREQQDRAA